MTTDAQCLLAGARAREHLLSELSWLGSTIPVWRWKWASTFEGGAEHSYVIKGRHVDATTYERAARIIHGAGTPRKFYRRLNIELHLPQVEVPFGREPLGQRPVRRGVKLWLMSHRTSVSKALNIAPVTAEYGRQDAPATATDFDSPWDLAALDFDDAFEASGALALGERLRQLGLADRHVTDLGSRAGAALDLGLAGQQHGYTAVESSRGLMHSLLFKHQWVRDVHVSPVEEFLPGRGDRRFETVVSLFGAASYLRPERIRWLHARSERLVLMHHLGRPERDFFAETHLPDWADASRAAATELPGARSERLGDYLLTVA
ncbi:hypothetical protein [Agrococcus sp. Marseille-Q4369]|uniref:hypothetical protein n=1 Tax=Agrococcus sp. Marseille-Q4369 TaxID=2810513 RepID=UPI001B8CF1B2|nr:hypothetical protein [Agrococcus sp. Marseille-Q4369]QUW17865.1 hypothetical protein JSQ78_08290 [Agrococcus sp. Marseille-Q4369]